MKGDNVKMNVLIQNANNRTPIFVFIHAKLQHCPLMIFFFFTHAFKGECSYKEMECENHPYRVFIWLLLNQSV